MDAPPEPAPGAPARRSPAPAPAPGRGHALLFLSILILLVVAGGIVAAARLLTARFEFLETRATGNAVTQALHAFVADLRQLDQSTRYYAEADEVEAFARSRDPALLKTTFSREVLERLGIDVLWLVTRAGEDVHSAELLPGRHVLLEPASAAVLAPLRPRLAPLLQRQSRPPTERLVRTASGILAVSLYEIQSADGSEPSGMLLVLGRFVRPELVQRVAEASVLDVRMVDLLDGRTPSTPLPAAAMAWLQDAPATARPYVLPINERYSDGFILLRGVTGKPALILAARTERQIHDLGRRSTRTLVGGIVTLVSLAMLAILAVLLRARRNWKGRIAAEHRYRQIVEQVNEAIMLVDGSSGRIVDCNAALRRLSGYDAAALQRMLVQELMPAISTAAGVEQALTLAQSQEYSIRRRDGQLCEAEISVVGIEESEQRLLCIVARDITPRKQAERAQHEHRRQLPHFARQDGPTGLPNRLYLQSRLPRVLHKMSGSEQLLAVMYVDVDHFKNINDSLGHASGDQVLNVVAKRLRACTRSSDVVVRMGGDEFVVVATLLPDRAATESIAAKVVAALQAPIALQASTVQVSASIGISLFPEDGLDAETLLKNADIALYQAKEAGRNNYQFFRSDMNVELSESVALEQALRHAIGSSQLYLEYQPIVDLDTCTVKSFEALCRWKHPEHGPVPPGRFIGIAEKSGLILGVGEFVLRQACFQLRRWVVDGVRVVPIGVNVSPLQLARTDFAALVRKVTREAEVDPQWLYFEITESALLDDAERHIHALEELRSMGCSIAIDDFGAGYSTFSYLKRMPVDTLKIDRSIIEGLTAGSPGAAVVRGIIDMARGLGVATVAEGVETAEQTAVLHDLGCRFAQGYGFSPPVSARRCRALLDAMGVQRRWSETMLQRALDVAGTKVLPRQRAAGGTA